MVDPVTQNAGLEDWYPVRRVLEVEIAALAAERADEDDIKALEQTNQSLKAAASKGANRRRLAEAQIAFHERLALATDNTAFILAMRTLRQFLLESAGTTAYRFGADAYEAILDAVKHHDAERARKAMSAHIQELERLIVESGAMSSSGPEVPRAEIEQLEGIARELRLLVLEMIYRAGSGHPGGSLSICEILAALYYLELRVDPCDPKNAERDRFILSKGHAAPALYAVLAKKGFFPKEQLGTLRKIGSILQGHPDMNKVPGVEVSSGSLGMGLSFGIGTALGARLNNRSYRTYVLTGCGELDEGQNWEAFMAAAKYGLDNLAAIVDYNRVQLDGPTDEIMPLGDVVAKISSFDWKVIQCDGHDIGQLSKALDQARNHKGRPTAIVAKTIKGKGVSFMENDHQWHGRQITKDDYERATAELRGRK
jgi:transketolase